MYKFKHWNRYKNMDRFKKIKNTQLYNKEAIII